MTISSKNNSTDEVEVPTDKPGLVKLIQQLESEKLALTRQVDSNNPERIDVAKQKNTQLKKELQELQKALASLILERKLPSEGNIELDQVEIFKSDILIFCSDAKLDPTLWKKLESL